MRFCGVVAGETGEVGAAVLLFMTRVLLSKSLTVIPLK